MHHFTVASLAILAFIPPVIVSGQDKNEAEELFKKFEEKLSKAKTFQLTYKSVVTSPSISADVSGLLKVDEGNKSRFTSDGLVGDVKGTYESISDGKKMVKREGGTEKPINLPAKLTDSWKSITARAGFFVSTMNALWLKAGDDDPKTLATTSAFTMGAKEKIEGQEAICIQFTATLKGTGEVKQKLWLNAVSHLPIKREYTFKLIEENTTCTETYSKLTVDEKIDPKTFEIP